MNKSKLLSNNIARGAIFAALSVIILYLSSVIPINTMFFLLASAAIIPLALTASGLYTAILVYFSTSLIGALFVPDKQVVVYYICLFGIYGIIKYFIEKLASVVVEVILKLLYFSSTCLLIFYLVQTLLVKNITTIPIYYFVLVFDVACFVLDYLLTQFVNYSNKHILKHIK
ncbi:hypothetical protein SAMN02745248_01329 [Hathewaya proteolytica DSM 3090]|uniref:Uncharacterized protein n=1 Tax=Hathewaya proteolytica DSM 3090 TaxID=1121331 RepID=A0A1M6N966_9CLOT|nr:hypothetical protein [Hathewaya proteolytica]SHJ92305.1 hypothetical protein SAMN02745248_01329 [Hathewaya proteolytica DSM 3090]